MSSGEAIAAVRAAYTEVQLAVWAILTAFAIYFAVFVAPKLPALQAAAERRRIAQIAAQDAAYCAKWRMGPGGAMHVKCLSDLQQLRAKIENRVAEEFVF